jgi:hypothetical protein
VMGERGFCNDASKLLYASHQLYFDLIDANFRYCSVNCRAELVESLVERRQTCI